MIQWVISLSNKYLLAQITTTKKSSIPVSLYLFTFHWQHKVFSFKAMSGSGEVCMCLSGHNFSSDSLKWCILSSAVATCKCCIISSMRVFQGKSLNPFCYKLYKAHIESLVACLRASFSYLLPNSCIFNLYSPSYLFIESFWIARWQSVLYRAYLLAIRLKVL